MQKPKIIRQIEQLWGEDFTLHPAPTFPTLLEGVMAFREDQPKYALDEQGRLIGLNLAATGLDDECWREIVNLLEEHAVQLQVLNLCDNQLKNFVPPPGITALTALDLEDNPLISPPPDVVKQGNAAVLKWLKDENKHPVLEAKVMFIGDSNYGKTHLIEMLRHKRIRRQNITTTHGIERSRIQDAEAAEGPIRLNVWDLGGQQFMRSTHQLFFTERTLYVLVTVARRERRELNHWLKLVHELGADTPVLVVINKIDQDDHDIDREPLQRDYPNIKGFVRTAVFDSTADSPVRGIVALDTINKLETEIHNIVSDRKLMPSVFVKQRREWFTVKKELEAMKEDYISYEDYQRRPHIKDLPAEEQEQTLKQLASLGTVVSFIDDDRLKDTHVINPQWLLDGIYCFINDHEIKEERRGEFSFADFRRLLDSRRYPAIKYLFLINLMQKFRLCYPLRCREDTWLLPDLFADIEPPDVWPKNADAMRFRLNYKNFPPDLFITQFIVERYGDIVDEKRWRSGVVVKDKISDCPAIVRRSFRHDHIEIEVAGNEKRRRSSLHLLLDTFSKLHQPYDELEIQREIPYKNVWLNYDHLLKLEQHDKPYFHPDLEEDILVSEVLDGYGRPGREHTEYGVIIEKLDAIQDGQDAHVIETKTGHARFEKKLNRIRGEMERFVKRSIDPAKLETHFSEVKLLIDELAQLPSLLEIPELAEKLEQWNKEPSKHSVKIVQHLFPTIIHKFIPMLPNIKFEYELDDILDKMDSVFGKISDTTE